jgi:hypothetical protein
MDSICQKYKNCQKCAKAEHGDECYGGFAVYSWAKAGKKTSPNYPLIRPHDSNDACQMDLFHCDKQFVEDTLDQVLAGNHDSSKNYNNGFDPSDPAQCVVAGTGSGASGSGNSEVKGCCGGHSASGGSWSVYTKLRFTCQNDGTLCKIGDACGATAAPTSTQSTNAP